MKFIKARKESLYKYWVKYPKLSYFTVYTLTFGIMCLFVFGYFAVYRKSFIYNVDGSSQHVNALAYYGEYLRNIISGLIKNHKLTVPMWDMNIGYGSDIVTTLHYYVIGDPLAITAAFVPKQYIEVLYILLILIRFYLTGLSFSCYCMYHKNRRIHILLGALVFCFSGYSLYAGIRHPYFINPMIYMPFILIGIDKIFNKEKPFIFIFSVFIAAISNFYFFYMICIFMFIYAVFQYVIRFKKLRMKELIYWLTRFIGYFIIAAGMACIILLPVSMSMLGSERITAERSINIFYEIKYYEGFLTSFMAGRQPGYWTVMGFTPIVLLSVFMLFARKKENKHLKIGFLLLTLFLFIPFIGRSLNGFSYVSNRWIWAYAMLNAYILVKMAPFLLTFNKKEKNRLIAITAAYIVLCIISNNARSESGIGALCILSAVELILLMDKEESGKPFIKNGILLAASCAGIIWISYSLYSVNMIDYTSEYRNLSYFSTAMYGKLPSNLIKNIDDDSVFRYGQYNTNEIHNSSMQQKLNSTAFYFSLTNNNINEYFNELYINYPLVQKYNGLDQRTILNTLASVKYFIIKDGNENLIPFNYNADKLNTLKKGSSDYSVYLGDNTLPIGYTYDGYITRDSYNAMTVTEKQQALLQGCVLEESSFNEINPVFNDEKINYNVKESAGADFDDGKIVISKPDASITLNFEGLDSSETYLIFENLKIEGMHPIDAYTDDEWNNMSVYRQHKQTEKYKSWRESASYTINAVSGKIKKQIVSVTDRNNFYSGKHDYLCNMGYSEEAKESIKLTFPKKGVYSFDDLRIVCQPMLRISNYVDGLKESVLEDIVIADNLITGTIALKQPKILALSIPYSDGWELKVDGAEAELKRANTMFMAVELNGGSHKIELRYSTPFIKQGAVISLISLSACIGVWLFFKVKK